MATIVVSHDGAQWLPAVLDGLAQQSVPPDWVVAVDTGSRDESVGLLVAALGEGSVVREKLTTTFPEAVRRGLEAAPATEWVWILHDDSRPDPEALAWLLEAAREHPDFDILGPKLREWPSLRRLLELGITISGTGRRETGLERGEYDQGQHDHIHQVLAVNTAGMLVRRSVLGELGGFDDRLPIFGNDIDFGWRAARAGHKTMVVPGALVFHAEAAHRGIRRTALTGRHIHLAERSAALYTLLVNCEAGLLPFQAVRLFLGSLLRVLGFLLVRSPGEALDEFVAVLSVYARPRSIIAARRARSPLAANDATVRAMLAPPWLPYRHGLDLLGDLVAAATNQAQNVAERRRAARLADAAPSAVSRAVPDLESDELGEDTGLVARFLTNPVALSATAFVLLMLWVVRDGFVAGALTGPGLSPVPETAGHWWRLYSDGRHPLAQGTGIPAPPYLFPFVLASIPMLGDAGAVLGLVLLGSVPMATWGAWRLLRVLGHVVDAYGAPRWLLAWGAATYGLVPIASGAWGQGRLGTVVAAAALPWLMHAALGFADPQADRRWRAAWRTGLLLALVTAFTPVAWLFALLVVAVLIGIGLSVAPDVVRDRSVTFPLLTPVAVVPVLLAPWFLPMLFTHPSALLLEAGRLPGSRSGGLDLLAGRLAGVGAPHWIGLVLLLLGVVALSRRATRVPVLVCWSVAVLAAVLAATLSVVPLDLPTTSARPSVGFFVVVLSGALVAAASMAAVRFPVSGVAGWRRWATHGVAAAAALVPLGGLGWAVLGHADDLERDVASGIPAYMTQNAELGPERGVLVVTGTVQDGLTYVVRRGDGVTLGEDEILAYARPDADLTEVVRTLTSRPTPGVVEELAGHGIEYVVLPAPADGRVASGLDATGGLTQASAEDPETRTWHVEPPPAADALDERRSPVHTLLVLVQWAAVVVVAVLCGPTRKASR